MHIIHGKYVNCGVSSDEGSYLHAGSRIKSALLTARRTRANDDDHSYKAQRWLRLPESVEVIVDRAPDRRTETRPLLHASIMVHGGDLG